MLLSMARLISSSHQGSQARSCFRSACKKQWALSLLLQSSPLQGQKLQRLKDGQGLVSLHNQPLLYMSGHQPTWLLMHTRLQHNRHQVLPLSTSLHLQGWHSCQPHRQQLPVHSMHQDSQVSFLLSLAILSCQPLYPPASFLNPPITS